jgi:hypothetical protein
MSKLLFLLLVPSMMYSHVVVHFNGRLGNQLFQAATAIALAQENQCEVYFPDFERLDLSTDDYGLAQLKQNYHYIFSRIPSLKTKIIPSYIYHEPDFAYHTISYVADTEIAGYFLSEKHFMKHKEYVVDLFSPTNDINQYLEERFAHIIHHPNTVGIHIRTGYLEYMLNEYNPKFYDAYLPPDMAFFKQAIERFDPNSLFIVFSDHIPWCKKQFASLNKQVIFVEDQEYIYDFYLLSKCKHAILANSTFGWWAAYLNKNPSKKVICRMPFWTCDPSGLQDIICSDWMTIDMQEKPPIPQFKGSL